MAQPPTPEGTAAPPRSPSAQPGKVLITWPVPGFVLQGARDVTGQLQNLNRGETINGVLHFITLPGNTPHRFLRLIFNCE